jgi:hypothetical protein
MIIDEDGLLAWLLAFGDRAPGQKQKNTKTCLIIRNANPGSKTIQKALAVGN